MRQKTRRPSSIPAEVPFTGYGFVFFFFAIVMPLRWLAPPRWAPAVLLAASVAFYLTWGWKLAILLGVLTLFTYGAGWLMKRQPERKKLVLAVSVVTLLGTLATFKYLAFFLSIFPGVKAPELPLPLGISFYVFEMISYVVDVYRGDQGSRSIPEFALYVSYFPHLIAGPIVRASELMPQLRRRVRFDSAAIAEGMFIMLAGFVKKMVLADNLAVFADTVFKKPTDFNGVEIGVAILAYTAQIFCDFSGYTDIARGASKMLGYDLPENFDYPYLSGSITEFWRRWHMTLSRWLRDYLYISLGGNRGSQLATYRNLLLTMTLGGLWHGARMTFVLWGVYHGVLLAVHRFYLSKTDTPFFQRMRRFLPYRVLAVACTLLLVMVGWVFFRAQSTADAVDLLKRLASAAPAKGWKPTKVFEQTTAYLAGVVVLHVFGAIKLGVRSNRALPPAARGLLWASVILLLYCCASSTPTFIYFYF